jgi:hypothetical protein
VKLALILKIWGCVILNNQVEKYHLLRVIWLMALAKQAESYLADGTCQTG